jgi:hypothetical protein
MAYLYNRLTLWPTAAGIGSASDRISGANRYPPRSVSITTSRCHIFQQLYLVTAFVNFRWNKNGVSIRPIEGHDIHAGANFRQRHPLGIAKIVAFHNRYSPVAPMLLSRAQTQTVYIAKFGPRSTISPSFRTPWRSISLEARTANRDNKSYRRRN